MNLLDNIDYDILWDKKGHQLFFFTNGTQPKCYFFSKDNKYLSTSCNMETQNMQNEKPNYIL